MSFFRHFFEYKQQLSLTDGENAVVCPFPHKVSNGISYEETHASAHVNLDKGLFHCKACDRGYNEVSFIVDYLGCDPETADKLAGKFKENIATLDEWDSDDNRSGLIDTQNPLNEKTKLRANNLGISDGAIGHMHMKTCNHRQRDDIMAFPVTMYGAVLGHKYYNPYDLSHVKTTSSKKFWCSKGLMSGLVLPWGILDNGKKDDHIFICAGEKDASNMLAKGIPAVTIHGGESYGKVVCPNLFINKKVHIMYDNDDAGRSGAETLANYLYEKGCRYIQIITGHHKVCIEPGEDVTDYFMKYGKTVDDIKQLLRETELFVPKELPEDINNGDIPHITVHESTKPEYDNVLVKSTVQVLAVGDSPFSIITQANYGNKVWTLKPENCRDVLYIQGSGFSESDIDKNIRAKFFHSDPKDNAIPLKTKVGMTAYTMTMYDYVSSGSNDSTTSANFEALVLGERPEPGKKYNITYKMVTHPFKGAQKVVIVTSVETAEDSVSSFKVTNDVKYILNLFKDATSETLVNELTIRAGSAIHPNLVKTIDLAFHTPLQINLLNSYGVPETTRGTLETLIIGESRTGKSLTTETAVRTYGLGIVKSLAGSAATSTSLMGGSIKTKLGGNTTKAGILPLNHKGLVVLEELGKANDDLLRGLTDIRSSGKARVTRLDGDLDLPCVLRTIYLTNPKTLTGNKPRAIKSFVNGIDILLNIVGCAEDIARFDMINIFGESPIVDYTKTEVAKKRFSDEELRTKIRWVWSRKPEDIIIEDEAYALLNTACNNLNKLYDTHIKIFGIEIRKKIARLAVALAGYTVSTDETYEHIVVKAHHIDEAVNFYTSLYINPIFKFDEYVKNERKFIEINDEGTEALNKLFNDRVGIALVHLFDGSTFCTWDEMTTCTGLSRPEVQIMIRPLVNNFLLEMPKSGGAGFRVTEKYRNTRPLVTLKRILTLNELGAGEE